ncbi:hypothetical protein Phum_PHUM294480 [Pediculus humanus corporis]|uniref:Uncharacterized protein n=1 Tax=Pediculus humanus subsp. corporis TaxID=121224 RepID=E0VLW2_PEDHC|nr:uncharacterized protein Phum_PHUM294480 [Pediculus humanus corporis]EEB14368.1 hypothetical protein Phum_PHUM294480 [Pediculus humanus corporis]
MLSPLEKKEKNKYTMDKTMRNTTTTTTTTTTMMMNAQNSPRGKERKGCEDDGNRRGCGGGGGQDEIRKNETCNILGKFTSKRFSPAKSFKSTRKKDDWKGDEIRDLNFPITKRDGNKTDDATTRETIGEMVNFSSSSSSSPCSPMVDQTHRPETIYVRETRASRLRAASKTTPTPSDTDSAGMYRSTINEQPTRIPPFKVSETI